MKKVTITIFAIVLVVALGCSLAACNSATAQGQLENPLGFDHNKETFVYDALNTYDGSLGKYTVKIEGFESGATVPNFGNAELENVEKGILVTGELEIDEDRSLSGCYFKLVGSSTTYMVPYASYNVQYSGDKEIFRLQATYGSKTYNYERTVNGQTDNGSIKVSGTCFDNNEFHQMLRTISTYSNGLTLAYTMPLVTSTEALAVNITATSSSTAKVATPFTNLLVKEDNEKRYPDGMDCYVVKINRSTQVTGASQTLYYAVDNVPTDLAHPNVRFLQHVLVKIVEPFKVDGNATITKEVDGKQVQTPIQMEYTLRDASIG